MSQSHLPFGESDIGASMYDGPDSILNPSGNEANTRVSKNIP